jgi:hypothetical protein
MAPTTPASDDFDEGAVHVRVICACIDTAMRAAFQWMNTHTPRDSTFLSWVDHGHAIAGSTGASRHYCPALHLLNSMEFHSMEHLCFQRRYIYIRLLR